MANESIEDELGYAIYEGVTVDFLFGSDKPGFGDLYEVCGESHPSFPPGDSFDFRPLADLRFSQIDDYFGIPSESDDGDEVVVWMFPLKSGQAVYHDSGPFDGVRLTYNVLCNPTSRQPIFEQAITIMASVTRCSPQYTAREVDLGSPPNLSPLLADIDSIKKHWRDQGTEPGSSAAMQIDF
tara:strand:- start:129 stop:674 length:546 start_codon:yes stop_codon:yes gene_type:complete